MSKKFASFKEFYPYYLAEHSNVNCRRLHFIGSWIVIGLLVAAILNNDLKLLWLIPLVGYGFAWMGHYFFEKNRPATFKYPMFSLMGDWVMWKDIIFGKVKI
ncbi:MAG: hypothetical protein ACI9R7_000701 [Lysobacterales bacterium]|jgi:hypothetical protein